MPAFVASLTSALRPAAAALSIAALLCASAQAADTPAEPPAGKADKLAAARAAIAAKKWPAALTELKKVNDTGNADWNNLMGFALRKNTPPDLAQSEHYYDAALKVDPNHKGALEYSGELYLMTDRLPQAEQRLATLDKVCAGGCDERDELKKAVARYKAAGNKYVADARW
jgi:opacity protein-like surface antigen